MKERRRFIEEGRRFMKEKEKVYEKYEEFLKKKSSLIKEDPVFEREGSSMKNVIMKIRDLKFLKTEAININFLSFIFTN